jgi:hypothetical protein
MFRLALKKLMNAVVWAGFALFVLVFAIIYSMDKASRRLLKTFGLDSWMCSVNWHDDKWGLSKFPWRVKCRSCGREEDRR